MQSFRSHRGRVAALHRTNVDTDQIIPKQFLKRIERTGFGPFLFYDWRFDTEGRERSEFELNHPAARGATILLTGANFGCGSSREHAPWALQDYGFRAIIAPSFADIFYGNCCQNGLLPVTLPEGEVRVLARRAETADDYQVSVDLVSRRVRDGQGFDAAFAFDEYRREMLLEGLDELGRTLLEESRIAAFERRRAALAARGPA
jgi:3-isopropylmalate/(R)-2-methylmalate dehydratase small subunit